MKSGQNPTQNNDIELFPDSPENGYSYAGKDELDEEPRVTAQYQAPEGFEFKFGYDESKNRWGHLLVPNQMWAPSKPSKPIDVQAVQASSREDEKPHHLQSTGPRSQVPQPQMFFSVSPSNSPKNSPNIVRKADRVELNFNHDNNDKTDSMDIDTPKLNGW